MAIKVDGQIIGSKTKIKEPKKNKVKSLFGKEVWWIDKENHYTLYVGKIIDVEPNSKGEVRVDCYSRAIKYPFEGRKVLQLTKLTFEKK